METRVYRLALRGAFHQGVQGFAREGAGVTVPSDTLFAALVVAWSHVGLDVDRLLAPFHTGEPPLLVSSTFPYAGSVRFYPRPLVRHRVTGTADGASVEKPLRKYDWVSDDLFGSLVRGEPLSAGALVFAQQRSLLVTQQAHSKLPTTVRQLEGDVRLWASDVRPRVTLDRVASTSRIYHVGRMQYAPQCGLWFAVQMAEPVWGDRVEKALDYLADAGLGGLRSIGHGAFSWSRWDGATLPAETAGDYAVTLARYAPNGPQGMAALLAPSSRYRLELVGGWSPGAGGARLRKQVRVVEAGSLLKAGDLHGGLVDVTPAIGDIGHPLYRYGYAFPVPVAPMALEEG